MNSENVPHTLTFLLEMPLESSLVPVVVYEDSHSESNLRDVLTGISLTLPDGTVITIRRGRAGEIL